MPQHVARLELISLDVGVRLVAVDVGKRVAVGAGKGHLRHEYLSPSDASRARERMVPLLKLTGATGVHMVQAWSPSKWKYELSW